MAAMASPLAPSASPAPSAMASPSASSAPPNSPVPDRKRPFSKAAEILAIVHSGEPFVHDIDLRPIHAQVARRYPVPGVSAALKYQLDTPLLSALQNVLFEEKCPNLPILFSCPGFLDANRTRWLGPAIHNQTYMKSAYVLRVDVESLAGYIEFVPFNYTVGIDQPISVNIEHHEIEHLTLEKAYEKAGPAVILRLLEHMDRDTIIRIIREEKTTP